MGKYIEGPAKGKAQFLQDQHNARILRTREEIIAAHCDNGEAVICVVDNGPFEAAGYCHDEREFEIFTAPDPRPKRWMTMEKKSVEKLVGFPESMRS